MAQALAAWGVTTSEALVKALKRPDSQKDETPNRIDIVQAAWADDEMYVPKKTELLLDATLETLSNSAKPKALNPCYLDARYWRFLQEALSPDASELLHALAGKYHFLQLAANVLSNADAALWGEAARPLATLARASIRRNGATHIDAVNASFLDVLRALPSVCQQTQVPATSALVAAMLEHWRPALELGSNAKKTSKFFVSESLEAFAAAFVHVESLNAPALLALLTEVSACALFGPPSPSSAKETQSHLEILDTLTEALVARLQSNEAVLAAFPCFLTQLVQAMQASGDSHVLPASLRKSVLERYIVPVCAAMHSGLQEKGTSFANVAVKARYALVTQIEAFALYQAGTDDEVWSALWTQLCADTLSYMRIHDSTSDCFATLLALWNVHSDALTVHLVDIFAETTRVKSEAWGKAQALIQSILDHFAQLREMPRIIQVACQVLTKVAAALDVNVKLAQSPFFCQETVSLWETRLRDATSHNQALPLLEDTLHSADQSLSESIPRFLGINHVLMFVTKNVGLNQNVELQPVLENIVSFTDRCIGFGDTSSAHELVVASGLRLRFVLMRRTLRRALATDESPPSFVAIRDLEQITKRFTSREPELVVESFRTALGAVEAAQIYNKADANAQKQLTAIVQGPLLQALELTAPKTLPRWDGQIFGMPAAFLPVALWRLITTRWLPVLDATTPDQLRSLILYLQGTLCEEGSRLQTMQAELSRMALRNAQFLEQRHYRIALLDCAANSTAWINLKNSPSSSINTNDVKQTLALTGLLDTLPITYFSRDSIDLLFPRLAWLNAALTVQNFPVPWIHLSGFLYRLVDMLNTIPQMIPIEDYIQALARLNVGVPLFVDRSMELLRMMLRFQKYDVHQLPKLLASFSSSQEMAQQTFTTILEWLADSDTILTFEHCSPLLQDVSPPEVVGNWSKAEVHYAELRLRAYAAQLRLCQTVRAPAPSDVANASTQITEAVGSLCTAVQSGVLTSTDAEPLARALFSTLITLHPVVPSTRPYVTLSVVFAALYVTLQDTATWLLPHFVSVVSQMPTDTYAETLEALEAAFADDEMHGELTACNVQDRMALLKALAVMLQHGPSGTSRIASERLSSLLVRLPLILHNSPLLAAPAVELIERVCNYRALILRPLDVPRIFAMVTVLIGPSGHEDRVNFSCPSGPIFSGIVSALRAMVRLRKDLLNPFLPQFTELLCLLIPLLQSLQRHNVGRSQLRRLAAAMPAWLDVATCPLGVTEARALTRLYTEIPAKSTSIATIVAQKRRRLSSDEHTSTTESLARSMSKHAVYILVAYVRCVTQGITTLATPVRQELQAGLFALCDLVNKYERDAVLKGMLDASGQVVFKTLWSDWERQRYKGA